MKKVFIKLGIATATALVFFFVVGTYDTEEEAKYAYLKCPDEYTNQKDKEDALIQFLVDKKTENPNVSDYELYQEFHNRLAELGCPMAISD